MWQVYAYLAEDLIESKRRDADRARAAGARRPRSRAARWSID